MTDLAPLTDAELAECELDAAAVPASAMPTHWDLAMKWTPRLIAEVRRLRAQEARADKVMQMVARDGHNDGSDGCLSCAAVAEWFGGEAST